MTLVKDQVILVSADETRFRLTPAVADEGIGPVAVFSGYSGSMSFGCGFTLDELDEMTAAFAQLARRARRANGIEVEATPEQIAEFERKLRERGGDVADTPPHPVLAALQAIVDGIPDHGEGSRFHQRSQFVWETIETYRTADDPGTIAEFVDDITTGDQVRECALLDGARAIARWLEEDRTTTPRAIAAGSAS